MNDCITLEFDPAKWPSCDTYSNSFSPLPKSSGIYALFGYSLDAYRINIELPCKLVYIGISRNLRFRLSDEHPALIRARNEFWHAARHFQECPLDIAQDLEALLVRKLNPPFNIQYRTES